MLPGNDFRDDDLEFGRVVYADRYRPYWTGKAPDYELIYHRSKLDGDVPADTSSARREKIAQPDGRRQNTAQDLHLYLQRTVVCQTPDDHERIDGQFRLLRLYPGAT